MRLQTRGIDALGLDRSAHGVTLRVLRPGPLHDWTSHAADAFRCLGMTLDRRAADTGFNRRLVYPWVGGAQGGRIKLFASRRSPTNSVLFVGRR